MNRIVDRESFVVVLNGRVIFGSATLSESVAHQLANGGFVAAKVFPSVTENVTSRVKKTVSAKQG